ncbi:hypothetical protein ACJMK2_022361 [Sinanodonta woodiana]|uniref:Uncharacterized protein n=1 Tax=Sinanodonta woodiana TaxID=1069815 RepID=A0ABD3TIU3_SINWO
MINIKITHRKKTTKCIDTRKSVRKNTQQGDHRTSRQFFNEKALENINQNKKEGENTEEQKQGEITEERYRLNIELAIKKHESKGSLTNEHMEATRLYRQEQIRKQRERKRGKAQEEMTK